MRSLPGNLETGRQAFRQSHSSSERSVGYIFLMHESVRDHPNLQPCKQALRPVICLHQSGLDPLVAPAAQRTRRTRSIGDPLVGTTEHQDLNQLIEDHSIGYARPVAAERVVGFSVYGLLGWTKGPDRLVNSHSPGGP